MKALDSSRLDALHRNDEAGRPAVDLRRLAAEWVLELLRGVDSSVGAARACALGVEFRWHLGGAPVKKSTLCTFRRDHLDALKVLSTHVLVRDSKGPAARASLLSSRS